MHYLDESHILLFLAQFFLLLLGTRFFGEVLRRFRQPSLTAELLVGIMLGPTVLGRFYPQLHAFIFPLDPLQQGMLETVAWLGVLFLLLETGLEIDFSIAWRRKGSALVIATSDIIIPLVISFLAVLFIPDRYLVDPNRRLIFALFMGTALTISAMPVTARVMQDLDLLKTDLGFLTMSALAVNDVIGWVLFTIILGIFAKGTTDIASLLTIFVATIGFAALVLSGGRRLSTSIFGAIHRAGLPEPGTSLTIVCLAGLLLGSITQRLGIHALFGFFLAGVALGESKELSEQTRSVISQMVHAIFVPLFFANIGLKLDFLSGFRWPLVTLVTVVGILGRYVGAWVGTAISKVPKADRNLISIGHTPGGMMEIVVALLAFEAGLITQQIFVAIVCGAVFSSMIIGPWMASAVARRKLVRLIDYVKPDLVLLDLKAQTRTAAIEELTHLSAKVKTMEGLSETILAREEEFGTAIGESVAIPHCRYPGIKTPVLVFGRSINGIDWDAPDGAPVHLIFLLATPAGSDDLHVQIIGQIAKAVHNRQIRLELLQTTSAKDLIAILDKATKGQPPKQTSDQAHNRLQSQPAQSQ
ncbi:MAG: cation:proton antiporter [Sedimentisphaerales bacterium]|nr:cation:proton antiporter [Sedimentisphaerales bacterium]